MAGSSSGSRGDIKLEKLPQSIVEDCLVTRSTCGYCRSASRTSIVHGLIARSLTVDDYQDLMDRGWRRSGCFVYKPEMERTCCPCYTIRLKAQDFVPSKEQKRVWRKMRRYLEHAYDGSASTRGRQAQENIGINSSVSGKKISAHEENMSSSSSIISKVSEQDNTAISISSVVDEAVKACVEDAELPLNVSFPLAIVKKLVGGAKKKLKQFSKDLVYTSNIAFQIAALLNRSLSTTKVNDTDEKLIGSELNKDNSQVSPLAIAEKLAKKIEGSIDVSKIRVQACNGHLNFILPTVEGDTSHDLKSKSSTVNKHLITLSDKKRMDSNGDNSPLKNQNSHHVERRKLEIRMKRSTFDPEEFDLYKKYQIRVHGDKPEDVKKSSYKRFLVDTPLIYVRPVNNNCTPPQGFGSFHQQYRIDGQLVAVGVVDVLPKCLSSKYLFWDPDLPFLSLGKYSALEEIKWVQEAQKHCPTLQYYYLGYYIHSCPKMRYKAAYNPSELLCPVRYEWVPFKVAKPLLDRMPYLCLSDYNAEGHSILPSDSGGVTDHSTKDDHEMEDVEMRDGDYVDFNIMSGKDDRMNDDVDPQPSSSDLDKEDISGVLLQLGRAQFRFKDLETFDFRDSQWLSKLIGHLQKYVRDVGKDLSERMAYCLF